MWANSPWGESYKEVWDSPVVVGFGSFALSKPLLLWINDGLMAIFFFLVGLEIKREILVGELASRRKAALPILAALGGMVAPALIYVAFNAGGPGSSGWAIPMATDIAFALGILALLGDRIPAGLKIFLTAVAIVDDLGAVIVIALFYTEQIEIVPLAAAGVLLAILVGSNLAGVRHPLLYAALGVVLWFAFLQSGVHATIAGVLLALTIPAKTLLDEKEFLSNGRYFLQEFEGASGGEVLANETKMSIVLALEKTCELAQTPLQRLEHSLQFWVAFMIMPLFALANAGVSLSGDFFQTLTDPVTAGVVAGLVAGKQFGISFPAWIAVRTGLASLPEGVSWRQIYGVAWLGGIGFTMSLFLANLSFSGPLLEQAKGGILVASVISGAVGMMLLRRGPAHHPTV